MGMIRNQPGLETSCIRRTVTARVGTSIASEKRLANIRKPSNFANNTSTIERMM